MLRSYFALAALPRDQLVTRVKAVPAASTDARQLRGFEATLLEAAARLASSRGVSSAALVDAGLVDDRRRLIFHGGMEDLSRFHLTIVWGGAAGPDDLGMHGRKQARRDQGIHGRRK